MICLRFGAAVDLLEHCRRMPAVIHHAHMRAERGFGGGGNELKRCTAQKHIQPGEEITFDYQGESGGGKEGAKSDNNRCVFHGVTSG